VDIAMTTERADEKRWIAFAPEVRATAQGATEGEAKELGSRFRGREDPHPLYWGGYPVVPRVFEFWQGRADLLRDRLRDRLVRGRWIRERLAP